MSNPKKNVKPDDGAVSPNYEVPFALLAKSFEELARVMTENKPTPPIAPTPTPPKFNGQGNYRQWELLVKRYIKKVPENEQRTAILGLLEGKALELAVDLDIGEGKAEEETFRRLRRRLEVPGLILDFQKQFHHREQMVGESALDFVTALRRLAERAFPDLEGLDLDRVIYQQFKEGINNTRIREELVLRPPEHLEEAIDLSITLEQLHRVDPLESCCSVTRSRSPRKDSPTRQHTPTNSPGPSNTHRLWSRQTPPKYVRFPNSPRTRRNEHFRRAPRRAASPYQPRDHPSTSKGEWVIPTTINCINGLPLPLVQVHANNIACVALVDTGAACSLIRKSLAIRCNRRKPFEQCGKRRLYGVDGSCVPIEGKINVQLHFAGLSQKCPMVVVKGLPFDLILGIDLLTTFGCKINLTTGTIQTSKGESTLNHGHTYYRRCHLVTQPLTPAEDQIQKLLDRVCVDGALRNALSKVVKDYSDIFAWEGTAPGRTNATRHRIDTGNAQPIRIPPRRLPICYQQEVNQMIEDMLRNNVIQPSESPWSSPVVLVKKKDGKLRLCVDYRRLNDVTKKDSFPLPRIDDLLEALGGSMWFSTLDLASGYWQVEMDEKDRQKTAFTLPCGLYEFQTMPFGLTNAPATFQRLMQTVLKELIPRTCLVYLDDVIVLGSNMTEHIANLSAVFERLRLAGLKLNPKKCHFLQKEVTYLGHIVSGTGIRTDPAKVEKVANWPEPRNAEELRSFLGLASYYRKFVPRFSCIVAPLNALLTKDTPFAWGETQRTSFQTLKEALCKSATLTFPDTTPTAGPFVLDTDASESGIGAVLSQRDKDGVERVIAYGSRTLNKAERNYCTTRKEMLALIFFIKQFRHYLLGRHFIVRTDHKALLWLQGFKNPEGQVARWQELLQEYDFECQHRPGKRHQNADSLSRRPMRNHGDCPTCTKEYVATVSVHSQDIQRWKEAQATDPELGLIYQRLIAGGDRPTSQEMAGSGHEARCLWSMWDQLCVTDDVMFVRYGPTYTARLVVPRELVHDTLADLHRELGHCGINKLEQAVRARFWWTHQHRDVVLFCNSCEYCGTFKNPKQAHRAPLQVIKTGYPNEIVGADIIGPMPETQSKNRYILVLVDYFTKWCEAVPLGQIDAKTVAAAIVDHWICRWGAPEQLHSDRGTSFENAILQELCRILGIDKTRTTPYHPQGNGQVERTNRSLKSLLKAFTEQHTESWDVVLPKCLLAYRSAVHKSTGQTPQLLWTGREVRLPSDIKLPRVQQPSSSVTEYVYQTLEQVRKTQQLAREKLETAHRHQKDYYDKKAYGAPLRNGDKVWLHRQVPDPGVPSKLHKEWRGPYIVERVINGSNCVIRGLGTLQGPSFVVHFNQLKPYTQESVPEVELELEVPPDGGTARPPGTTPS